MDPHSLALESLLDLVICKYLKLHYVKECFSLITWTFNITWGTFLIKTIKIVFQNKSSSLLFFYIYSRSLLVISFIQVSVYMSISISQFIPPPPHRFPPLVSIRLFSTSVSLFLPCKLVHLYHFSKFHIYALIYDICFSLSDLLHLVW